MNEGGTFAGDPFVLAERWRPMRSLLRYVTPADIPPSEDLCSAADLEESLAGDAQLSLLATGDIMIGGRAKRVVATHGAVHLFEAVLPILRRAPIVLGNLEGPIARKARREERNHSYRLKPEVGRVLKQVGITALTLANNHLMDCGRAGVSETLETLAAAGLGVLGAGPNQRGAHKPVIQQAGRWRVGLLGYYWNRRCAATETRPGSAMDPREALAVDIGRLQGLVDRIVVTFHWGIPYEREPSAEDCAKARFAVDCGADVVIGHHPHIIQRFEVYRNRPIFYSIGNFVFGSGNSRAEGVMVGLRFGDTQTTVEVHPLYVKNRDARVNYQPKVLRGESAARVLRHLIEISGSTSRSLRIEAGCGKVELPW